MRKLANQKNIGMAIERIEFAAAHYVFRDSEGQITDQAFVTTLKAVRVPQSYEGWSDISPKLNNITPEDQIKCLSHLSELAESDQ